MITFSDPGEAGGPLSFAMDARNGQHTHPLSPPVKFLPEDQSKNYHILAL
jgi:hypothetical protein